MHTAHIIIIIENRFNFKQTETKQITFVLN